MKNKIEFPKNSDLEKKEFLNQTSAGSSFGNNQGSETKQEQRIKSSKIIKGKVKIFNNNNEVKFVNNDWLDEETELTIVLKRMSIFLKLTFLFLIALTLLVLLKKGVL
jgi:hypothetical protein